MEYYSIVIIYFAKKEVDKISILQDNLLYNIFILQNIKFVKF